MKTTVNSKGDEMTKIPKGFKPHTTPIQPIETVGKHVQVLLATGDRLPTRLADALSWSTKSEIAKIVAYRVLKGDHPLKTAKLSVDEPVVLVGHDCGVDQQTDNREYTGGAVNYYKVDIDQPTSLPSAYTAECNDIIEALGMSFAEGEAFKAIWRGAAARMNKSKRGYTDGLYDAEKVAFYGGRMVATEKAKVPAKT